MWVKIFHQKAGFKVNFVIFRKWDLMKYASFKFKAFWICLIMIKICLFSRNSNSLATHKFIRSYQLHNSFLLIHVIFCTSIASKYHTTVPYFIKHYQTYKMSVTANKNNHSELKGKKILDKWLTSSYDILPEIYSKIYQFV